jgi:hypothetical protein
MTQWGLDTLFNPAKRHMDEEKRRLQATRQQVGDTSGGKRIDLESGKVRIKPGGTGDPADELADDATDEPTEAAAGGDKVTAKNAPAGKRPKKELTAKKELTPAQLRAAQRRGRAPR